IEHFILVELPIDKRQTNIKKQHKPLNSNVLIQTIMSMTNYMNFTETLTTMLQNESTSASTSINESSSLDDLCKNFHLIVFLCIIFVLIVSANISVILQLTCSKKRRSRMSFFLLNLAYAGKFKCSDDDDDDYYYYYYYKQ
ncbi:unnamed protein product, partial [Rotaria socialis]